MVFLITPLYRYLQYPFLDSDSFSQRCRKHIFTVALIIAFLMTAYILSAIPALISLHSTSLVFSNCIDGITFITCMIPLYLYMRSKRHVSDTLTFVTLGVILCINLYQSIRDANGGVVIYIQLLTVCAVIGQVPNVRYLVVSGILIILIHYYNIIAVTRQSGNTTSSGPSYPPMMLPTPWGNRNHCNEAGEWPMLVYTALTGVLIWVVYAQTKAFSKQLNVALCNALIARTVAEMLSLYDTEKAAKYLSEQQEEGPENGDEALMKSLSTIVHNMEQYRPYLPNYLLSQQHKAMMMEAGGGDGDDDDSNDDVRSLVLQPVTQTSSPTSSIATTRRSSIQRRKGSFAVEPLPLSVPAPFHMRPVTIAKLNFHDIFTTELATRSIVTEFVETIHSHATAYGAAVHSFLGDDVIMSWNALSRCVHHYHRGVLMMMELKRETTVSFNMCASVTSGPVRCQRGGVKTFAWTLHAPSVFHELDLILNHVGRKIKRGCVLTSAEHIKQVESFGVTSQAIDAIRVSSGSILVVHEVLWVSTLAVDEDKDSEWMYRLQQAQQKNDDPLKPANVNVNLEFAAQVTECVAVALKTSPREALQKLEELLLLHKKEQDEDEDDKEEGTDDVIQFRENGFVTPGVKHLLQRLKDSSVVVNVVEGNFPLRIVGKEEN
eukprot:PhF_6_TR10363/c0_g1_i14/m.16079